MKKLYIFTGLVLLLRRCWCSGKKKFPLSATTPTTGFNECTTSLEHLKNIHQKPDLMSTQQT